MRGAIAVRDERHGEHIAAQGEASPCQEKLRLAEDAAVVDAAVFEFILRGFSNGDDFDIEVKRFSGERVIAIDIDIFLIDGDDPEGEGFSVFGFCGHARADLELSALWEY